MAITDPLLIAQYSQLHQSKSYGRGPHGFYLAILASIVGSRAQTVLEYGCGQSTLGQRFVSLGIEWSRYDPAVPALATPPEAPHDLVVCTDVLEHIPATDIDDVLADIKRVSPKVFLNISTRLAREILPDGTNAHCTVWSPEVWLDKVRRHFPEATVAHVQPGNSCVIVTWSDRTTELIAEIERTRLELVKRSIPLGKKLERNVRRWLKG